MAVGLLVIGLVPPALSAARVEHKDIHVQRARTIELGKLNSVIAQLGGAARLRGCGEPLTRLEYQTALAYTWASTSPRSASSTGRRSPTATRS